MWAFHPWLGGWAPKSLKNAKGVDQRNNRSESKDPCLGKWCLYRPLDFIKNPLSTWGTHYVYIYIHIYIYTYIYIDYIIWCWPLIFNWYKHQEPIVVVTEKVPRCCSLGHSHARSATLTFPMDTESNPFSLVSNTSILYSNLIIVKLIFCGIIMYYLFIISIYNSHL